MFVFDITEWENIGGRYLDDRSHDKTPIITQF